MPRTSQSALWLYALSLICFFFFSTWNTCYFKFWFLWWCSREFICTLQWLTRLACPRWKRDSKKIQNNFFLLEPGTAPRKVVARPLSSSTMVIQWDEPETPNGQVTVSFIASYTLPLISIRILYAFFLFSIFDSLYKSIWIFVSENHYFQNDHIHHITYRWNPFNLIQSDLMEFF